MENSSIGPTKLANSFFVTYGSPSSLLKRSFWSNNTPKSINESTFSICANEMKYLPENEFSPMDPSCLDSTAENDGMILAEQNNFIIILKVAFNPK